MLLPWVGGSLQEHTGFRGPRPGTSASEKDTWRVWRGHFHAISPTSAWLKTLPQKGQQTGTAKLLSRGRRSARFDAGAGTAAGGKGRAARAKLETLLSSPCPSAPSCQPLGAALLSHHRRRPGEPIKVLPPQPASPSLLPLPQLFRVLPGAKRSQAFYSPRPSSGQL